MVLMGINFVQSSRSTISVNTLPKNRVRRRIITNRADLRNMQPNDSAVDLSPNTQLGRRIAYWALLRNQRWEHNGGDREDFDEHGLVTYYHMCTYYNIQRVKRGQTSKLHPLETRLRMNDDGSPVEDLSIPRAFLLPGVGLEFRRRDGKGSTNRPLAVQVAPYAPVNRDDERFCYSALLLHTPWPVGGEDHLLRAAAIGTAEPEDLTAVEMFKRWLPRMAPYVQRAIEGEEHTQTMLETNGQCRDGAEVATDTVEGFDDEGCNEPMDADDSEDAQPTVDPELENIAPAEWDAKDYKKMVHWNVSLEKYATTKQFLELQKVKLFEQVSITCESLNNRYKVSNLGYLSSYLLRLVPNLSIYSCTSCDRFRPQLCTLVPHINGSHSRYILFDMSRS